MKFWFDESFFAAPTGCFCGAHRSPLPANLRVSPPPITTDYICPGFTDGRCTNAVRFKRKDVDAVVFDLLKQHLLSDSAVIAARSYIESTLQAKLAEEASDAPEGTQRAALERLVREEEQLRSLSLRPPP
jgi:hypothetical protein